MKAMKGLFSGAVLALLFISPCAAADMAGQTKLQRLSEEGARRLHEYRQVLRHEKRLHSYNDQVERMIAAQEKERASFEGQSRDIETLKSEIFPLILNMLKRLEDFVAQDLPFLIEERQARLRTLRDLMDRPDLSVAEKYRHVIKAYRSELEYGRTIEARNGTLGQGKDRHMVDILRLGRLALYALSFDGLEAAYWDPDTRRWRVLSKEHLRNIKHALRVARKEARPGLLTLPIPAPKALK